jgi:hypothetical protein
VTRQVVYVENIEAALVKTLQSDAWAGRTAAEGGGPRLKEVALPAHLFGELGKSDRGCEVLRGRAAELQKMVALARQVLNGTARLVTRAALSPVVRRAPRTPAAVAPPKG